MRAALKRLSQDTVIYGTSTVVSRFLNFLLIPYYTHVLVPAEFGIQAVVFSWITFLNILYSYGMEAAYFRFAADAEEGNRKTVFSTPFLSLVGSSLLFGALILLFGDSLAALIDRRQTLPPESMRLIVELAAGILLCDTLCILPFAALRLQHRPARFSAIKITNIFLQVVFNILFLSMGWGVAGIFTSNLIASSATLVLLLPTISREFVPKFSGVTWRTLLGFGLPYLPSGISLMILQVIDRPILQAMTDESRVGIYNANYRLGIVMMVFVSMFEYAWRPFFLGYASNPDAKRVFARVLTYFTAAAALVFLGVSFFVESIAHLSLFGKTFINQQYWGGLTIVPIVLAAYVFHGWYTNMIAGVYIEKKTNQLPMITGVAAATNVIANFLLIPPLGIAGAAWATLISYAVMAGMMFVATRSYYPVPYEWGRIGILAIATCAVFAGESALRQFLDGSALFGVRIALLLVFGGSLFAMRFFSAGERAFMRGVLERLRVVKTQDVG